MFKYSEDLVQFQVDVIVVTKATFLLFLLGWLLLSFFFELVHEPEVLVIIGAYVTNNILPPFVLSFARHTLEDVCLSTVGTRVLPVGVVPFPLRVHALLVVVVLSVAGAAAVVTVAFHF